LRVLLLHEPILKGGTLHSMARNVPKDRFLCAAQYMIREGVQVDIGKHSSNSVLKFLTKPLMPFFVDLPDAIRNCGGFYKYDILFSISDYDAFGSELLRRLIQVHTPHVAISYGLTNLISASPRARSIKKVVGLNQFYKLLLNKISVLVVHSKPQMACLRALLDIPSDRTEFLPLCVDADFFKPQSGTNSYVMSIGRDSGRDYGTLIRAFKKIDCPLRIVCGTKNLRKVPTPKNVITMIEIPYNSLRTTYQDAKFIILPIRNYQSLSGQVALLESLAMGKAVIATKCWGTTDYIEDGKTGFFVEAGNEIDLKRKIDYLLENPDIAETVGRNGRKFVEDECSLSSFSKNVCKLLKTLTHSLQ